MTYWSRYSRMAVGLGRSSSLTSLVSASSSSMISLHRSMHSSQMYTPGPAISLRTCFWLLPQKEHFSKSPPSPIRAMSPLDLDLASSGRYLVVVPSAGLARTAEIRRLTVTPDRTRCTAARHSFPRSDTDAAGGRPSAGPGRGRGVERHRPIRISLSADGAHATRNRRFVARERSVVHDLA